jgi:uncharacterized RmlC-like cupin family protein
VGATEALRDYSDQMADPSAPLTYTRGDALEDSDPTPGMLRRRAFATDTMWSGTALYEPRTVTGWHHHGAHETTLYVVTGSLHLEFGPGGGASIEAVAGDFVQVPAGAVHRESITADEPALLVVVRCGHGEPTVNVDGPPPA